MYDCFAVTAPGLAPLAERELAALGLKPRAEVGGVRFSAGMADLYRTNLALRTASRVIVRLGSFHVTTFAELVIKTAKLEWERYLAPARPVSLHVTCHKSKLYHSDAVAERVSAAIHERLGKPAPVIPGSISVDEDAPAQLVIVRLQNDKAVISIDSSGSLLHRRGWRLETAKAPLRETLAAAMLLASGWDTTSPLVDPLCGSGTIPIEAALMALHRPPGCSRRFAFMDWPNFNPGVFKAVRDACASRSEGSLPAIIASDRDAGAISIARANAERAGVAGAIEFSQRSVSAISVPTGPGWMVTNPPYGLRVSEGKDLRNLYAQLGNVLRERCPNWHVAILSSSPVLIGQTGLGLDASFSMVNGGVSVKLGMGKVPGFRPRQS